MNVAEIICIGEAMVELSLDGSNADAAQLGVAGDTFNTAIYLKRSAPDLRVAYATKLGHDFLSDRIIDMMREERLETDLTLRSDVRLPGLYAISTDAAGERSFLYWRETSAARALFEPPALSLDTLAAARLIYLSAISLAILPADHRAQLLVWLGQYRKRGGMVAFDSNYRPALWRDEMTAKEAIVTAWRQTDIALPSVDDEIALFGDKDAIDVIERLRSWGVSRGALKRGALGPMAIDGTVLDCYPPAERIVDSTAAGDSFNGAYLAAYLSGKDQRACLRAGHELARRVVGARGAILPRDATSDMEIHR